MMSSGLATSGLLGGRFGGGGGSGGPFDAIRQHYMSQRGGRKPPLMRPYQDQAGMSGSDSTGVLLGGEDPAAKAANKRLAQHRKQYAKDLKNKPRQWAPHYVQRQYTRRMQKYANLKKLGKAPKTASGSFYKQALSGTGLKDWKWNKVAR